MALGKVVQKPVEEVPRKEQDQNLLKLKMVEMNALAVTQIHVLVIQTIVQVLLNNHTHTYYTLQDPLLDDCSFYVHLTLSLNLF